MDDELVFAWAWLNTRTVLRAIYAAKWRFRRVGRKILLVSIAQSLAWIRIARAPAVSGHLPDSDRGAIQNTRFRHVSNASLKQRFAVADTIPESRTSGYKRLDWAIYICEFVVEAVHDYSSRPIKSNSEDSVEVKTRYGPPRLAVARINEPGL